MVLHPESMTTDAKLILQNENRGLRYSAKSRQKRRHRSLFGCQESTRQVINLSTMKDLGGLMKQKWDQIFSREARGPDWSSKATSALRERAEGSQEAEAAASEIGHYIVTEGLGSEGRRWSSGWN